MSINKIPPPPPYAANGADSLPTEKTVRRPSALKGLSSALLSRWKPASTENRGSGSAERRRVDIKDPHLKPDPIRAKALADFLSKKGIEPARPPLPLVQDKSLQEIAEMAGVQSNDLESHIKRLLADRLKESSDMPPTGTLQQRDAFVNILCHLHMLGQRTPLAASWLQHLQSFDAFVSHFCPMANGSERAALIADVDKFLYRNRPSMLVPEICLPEYLHRPAAACSSTGHWVKLPDSWVDVRVLEEALALAKEGIPQTHELLVHATGSAALDGIAKCKAILSAEAVHQQGGTVHTGEFVSLILADPAIKTPQTGDGQIFADDTGMSHWGYSMLRWFDEARVTFGISKRKQRAHIQASNPFGDINKFYAGYTIGPTAPLENVAVISAPKENEARIREWIADHCPHAKFVSYQAVNLLEDSDMYGLLPRKAG